ncbi:MAG TPA: Na+/H+ antiporter subunit C [Halomonas sp.]|nr:Na+/H+ antiporter subunit C [Halomonas sp.]
MELLYAITLGVLTSCGIYLLLRARTFTVILGLTLLSHAVNLYLFASGRLVSSAPAIVGLADHSADPVPQALVLTAIVIGFAMTAFVVVLALKAAVELRNDHVDGENPDEDRP